MIYILSKKKSTVRVKNITAMLNIKPSSVVEFLNKLSRKCLAHYIKHEVIKLTRDGLEIAEKNLQETYSFKRILNTCTKPT